MPSIELARFSPHLKRLYVQVCYILVDEGIFEREFGAYRDIQPAQ